MLVNLALPVDKPSEDATPGEILLYHRVNRGISHQELADKLGYKRAYGIVDLERGFNPIHYKDAVKLGEILNISPDELLNEHTRFCKPGYGICIAKIREMYGMTQQEFSDLISVTRSRLSAWESECTGFHPNEESFNKIKNLAVGIGIDFNRLMDNPAEYRDEYNIFVESNWGLKIKQIRLAHGMLLEEYASVIGCDKQTLEHWEIECVRPLRKYFPAIKETAIACGIELDRLNANPSYFGSDFQRFIEKDCNKKIKSIRMAYGMTTYALGNLIGCTGEAVCRWERGICTPELKYFKTIERIAKEKGITIAELNETPELIGDDYELFCNSGYSKVIRSIRKQCGMLQGEFAKELDVSRSSLANWEQGRFIPSRDNYNILKKYAEERGLSLDES